MSTEDSSFWLPTSRSDSGSSSSIAEEDRLSTRVLHAGGVAKNSANLHARLHWPQVPGYEILSEIGSGAMGIVYKAMHLDLRRTVALKMLRGVALSDPFFRERFRAEAEAVAKLQHPNIIQVFEIGTAAALPGELNASLFISLEFVGGGSLAQHAGKQQAPHYAASIVEKLARATHYAHQAGVIHRDLKPANVLMGLDDEPKIADFGVAKQLGDDQDEPGRCHTLAGTLIGTPEYMAPEQVAGATPTPSIDIYALGVILYELLTARVPFQGATSVETLDLVRHQEPSLPASLHGDLPADVKTICLKCLEKQPNLRYATALDLADDLHRFQEDRPIRARRIGELEKCRRWCRRNPALAVSLIGTICVFAIAFLLVTNSYLRAEDALREEAKQTAEAQRNQRLERWERYRANLGATASAIQLHNVGSAFRTLEAAPEEYRNWEWRHFFSRLDSSQHVLRICEPQAKNVGLSRDGTRALFVGLDGQASVWDPANLKRVRSYPNTPEIWESRLSPDGRTFLYLTKDHSLILRDIESDRILAVLPKHDRPLYTAQFTADSARLLSYTSNRTVRTWNARTGELMGSFRAPKGIGNGMSISPDGSIAALTEAGKVDPVLWDLSTGKAIATLAGHTHIAGSMCFNHQGDRLITTESYPGLTLRFWDAHTGKLLHTSHQHTNGIASIEFSQDRSRFATGSMDQTIGIWDGSTGQPVAICRGHTGWVNSVAFSPDGKRLVSGSQDRTIRLWDTTTGESLAILHGHTAEIFRVSFTADGSKIISVSGDGTARIWDAQMVERNGVLKGHTGFVYHVAIHPDGERVASASWDGTVRIWNMTTGRQLMSLNHGDKKVVAAVAFHPNGRLLASRDREAVHLWDVESGNEVHRFNVPSDWWRDTRLAFSPNGRLLAAGCADKQIRLWDVEGFNEVGVLRGHEDEIRDVAFSPDGRWLASAGDKSDRTIRIWDVEKRAMVQTLHGHMDGAYAVAFHPDGSLLASARRTAPSGSGILLTGRKLPCSNKGRMFMASPSPPMVPGWWAPVPTMSFDSGARIPINWSPSSAATKLTSTPLRFRPMAPASPPLQAI